MSTRLAILGDAWAELVKALDDEVETAFVAIAGIASDADGLTILVRRLVAVPEDAYLARTATALEISSAGFMPAFGQAATMRAAVGLVHTHPRGRAAFSDLDDVVDSLLAPVAQLRTQQPHYFSVVVSGDAARPGLAARVFEEGEVSAVGVSRIVGPRTHYLTSGLDEAVAESNRFDRQVRAFGIDGQARLAALKVGVVGVGGTGSAVCEELARLGVGELVVADDDHVTESNISRIYGSGSADVGRRKVDVIADNVQAIGSGTRVTALEGRVNDLPVVNAFKQCDFIFGCTDDQSGRAVLSRLAYWYLIPILDLGVIVSSSGGEVSDVVGRVTFVGPRGACLLCRRRIDPAAVAAESLSPAERSRLVDEGYVQGLAEPDPAVVPYTTAVAAAAVSEFLHGVIGLTPRVSATEILLFLTERDIRLNDAVGNEGHYCVDESAWGAGDSDPPLGMVWT